MSKSPLLRGPNNSFSIDILDINLAILILSRLSEAIIASDIERAVEAHPSKIKKNDPSVRVAGGEIWSNFLI